MHLKILISLVFIISAVLAQKVEEYENETETDLPETSTLPITTTESTSTSTTTTTESTTTVAPPSPSHYFYNVTENNVTCVMLDGSFTFAVTYSIGGNKTNQTTVSVPKPSPDVTVDGSCHDPDGNQFIEIAWGGKSVGQSNIRIVFNSSDNQNTWSVKSFTSLIYLDKDEFVNGTDNGKSLYSDVNFQLTPSDLAANHSLKCFSRLTFSNVTTLMENRSYSYPVVMAVDGIQIEAFNKAAFETKFVEAIHCDADKIADIVPIAVGCALAALVTIVLIAYIVGRRRRSAAYQSV